MLMLARIVSLNKDSEGCYLVCDITYPHSDRDEFKNVKVREGITDIQKVCWFNDTPYACFGLDMIDKTVILSGWFGIKDFDNLKFLGVLNNGL